MKHLLLLLCLSIISKLAFSAPVSLILMKRNDQKVYLVGDWHDCCYEQSSASKDATKKFDQLLEQIAENKKETALFLWEMSALRHERVALLPDPSLLSPLFIAQKAIHVKNIIDSGAYPHIKYQTADDIRMGNPHCEQLANSLGELQLEKKALFDLTLREHQIQKTQEIINLLQDGKNREEIINHIEYFNKTLKYSLQEDEVFKQLAKDYRKRSKNFIKWMKLFENFEQNASRIDEELPHHREFFLLFPPNLEFVFNIFFSKAKTCLAYAGRDHIDLQRKTDIPSIVDMLKKLGFEEVKRSEINFSEISI
jgi:hypothetical protein